MSETDGLTIEGFVLGPYQTNCYVVRSGAAWFLVDCGFEPGAMLDRAEAIRDETGRDAAAVVLTHAHLDHIAGLNELRSQMKDVPIWIHAAEERWLVDAEANMSALAGMPVTAPPADRLIREGEELDLAGMSWRVLHTPGHSPGGVTLHASDAGVAIVGDALFRESIGRTDFPGSSFDELETSIRENLYTLPGETRVLPGHGPATTIGHERAHNPFVKPA